MKMPRYAPLLLWLALTVAPWSVHAATEVAGIVLVATGSVTAAQPDGDIRELRRGARIFVGDTLSTASGATLQVRFNDRGIVALRADSRFVVERFEHTGDPVTDRSEFSLLKGGFRAITGAIGEVNPDAYSINTPVASIGIRGTEHFGRYCLDDCLDLMNQGVAPPDNGLYTGTHQGRTLIGGKSFGPGQYGFTDQQGNTRHLGQPPRILALDLLARLRLNTDELPDEETGEDEEFEIPDPPNTRTEVDCPQ